MKEEEAKIKYCPLYGCAVLIATSCSTRDLNTKPLTDGMLTSLFCLASSCMVWRWETLEGNMPSSGRIVEIGKSKTEGYCGLARQL